MESKNKYYDVIVQQVKTFTQNCIAVLVGSILVILLVSTVGSLLGTTLEGEQLSVFGAVFLVGLAFGSKSFLFFLSFLMVMCNRAVNPYILAITAGIFMLLATLLTTSIDQFVRHIIPDWNVEWGFVDPSTIAMAVMGVLLNVLVFRSDLLQKIHGK